MSSNKRKADTLSVFASPQSSRRRTLAEVPAPSLTARALLSPVSSSRHLLLLNGVGPHEPGDSVLARFNRAQQRRTAQRVRNQREALVAAWKMLGDIALEKQNGE